MPSNRRRRVRARPRRWRLVLSWIFIDASGNSLADVDIVTLLLSSYRPYMPAGFLDRQALVACGLNSEGWLVDSIELEIWCRLAAEFGLRSSDHQVVEASKPWLDMTAPPQDLERGIRARLDLVAALFSEEGFFEGAHPALMLEAQINQLSTMRQHAEVLGVAQSDAAFTAHLQNVVDELRTLLMSDHRVLRSRSIGRQPYSCPGVLSRPLGHFLGC